MTPFFFGTGARRLFGIYEPASVTGRGTRAAVLCHPWGEEYIYAHRAMRRLAVRLSASGFHTLRFDFFGTGDSAGDMTDADLSGWEDDTALAMDELRHITNAARISLIGLRLGGTIAARVALRHASEVDALVLWDPIISGVDYPPGADGFSLTEAMRREIRAIALGPLLAAPVTRSLLAVTERHPLHASLPAVPAGPDGGSLEIDLLTDIRPWLWTGPSDTLGAMPVEVIERIGIWLG
jgi:pimeloyl-ACP methyl ester carboxylesterase